MLLSSFLSCVNKCCLKPTWCACLARHPILSFGSFFSKPENICRQTNFAFSVLKEKPRTIVPSSDDLKYDSVWVNFHYKIPPATINADSAHLTFKHRTILFFPPPTLNFGNSLEIIADGFSSTQNCELCAEWRFLKISTCQLQWVKFLVLILFPALLKTLLIVFWNPIPNVSVV